MMEEFGIFVIILIVSIVIVSGISKRIMFPKWARWKASTPWKIEFFDRNKYLKLVVIKTAQLIVLITLLLILLFKTGIKLALKMMPKMPKVKNNAL